jgi:hypothetical protein
MPASVSAEHKSLAPDVKKEGSIGIRRQRMPGVSTARPDVSDVADRE